MDLAPPSQRFLRSLQPPRVTHELQGRGAGSPLNSHSPSVKLPSSSSSRHARVANQTNAAAQKEQKESGLTWLIDKRLTWLSIKAQIYADA